MAPIREDKPTWGLVPVAVRVETERILEARVARAFRAFGGYGPSATFRLTLVDGRRAFFKGVYPVPEQSAVRWSLDEEALVYERIGDLIRPWAPELYGSLRVEGWHALLLEDIAGTRVPPWSVPLARRAARSYAEFHAANIDRALPGWLPRETHLELSSACHELAADDSAVDLLASLAEDRSSDARRWFDRHLGALNAAAVELDRKQRRTAILHFDTRSDNIRVQGDLLRIFDWPFACGGPPEVDLAAFAQSIVVEGGPAPEKIVAWYSEILPVRAELVAGSVAGLVGFFGLRAPRPEMVGLPRLRSWQRRQFKSCLAWAARLLGLTDPGWLDAVAD